jgi:hypothetical protein
MEKPLSIPDEPQPRNIMRADLVTVIFRASMSVAYSTAVRAADVASDDRAAPYPSWDRRNIIGRFH